jgi:hypothetical protein
MTRRVAAHQIEFYSTDTPQPLQDFALDLGEAIAEIAALREYLAKVCEAAIATQRAFEKQVEYAACDDKAESMGGRVDPLCDVCMERWAVSHDALDDAIAAARKVVGE